MTAPAIRAGLAADAGAGRQLHRRSLVATRLLLVRAQLSRLRIELKTVQPSDDIELQQLADLELHAQAMQSRALQAAITLTGDGAV
jgi:hypothetical protein